MVALIRRVAVIVLSMPLVASAASFSLLGAGERPALDGELPAALQVRPASSLEDPGELVWGPEAGDWEISPSFSFMGDSYDVGENTTFTGQLFAGMNVTPIFQVGASFLYTSVKARDPVNPGPPASIATTGPTATMLIMPTMRVHFVFDKEARFDPYLQFAFGGGRVFPRGPNGGAFAFGPGGGIRSFVVPKAALDFRFEYLFISSKEDYESARFLLGGVFLFDL